MKEIEYSGTAFKKEEERTNQKRTRSKGSEKVPTVRTFRADVEELIEEKGTTKTQIVMAEAARREGRGQSRVLREEEDSHLGKIIFLLALVLAFVIGIGAYVLIGTKTSLPFVAKSPAVEVVPITTDKMTILISGSPREQILADLSLAFGKTSLPQDQSREVSFVTKDANGDTHPATTSALLDALSQRTPPDELIRSLSEAPFYGIYSAEKLTGYIQIASRSYPNTFSGMLSWEPSMYQDLTLVLNPWYNRENIKDLVDKNFEDEHIGNTDARVLKDGQGATVIAYAFVNKKILLITNSTTTLLALETKLAE